MIDWQVTSSHISSTVNVTYTLRKILEKDGYDVQAYNDPRLALESFKGDLLNLVLLDIRMPHMDSFKLLGGNLEKKDDKVRV